MKNPKFLIPVFLFLLAISSCIDDDGISPNCEPSDGPIVEQVLNISGFSGVEIKTSTDVFITQGPVFEVVAKGEQNIIDLLDTRVRNGVWEIDFNDCVKNYSLEIFITLPEIDYLEISGSGEIRGDNFFEVDDITLRISGSGDMCLGLFAQNIDARISGSGEMDLEGETDNLDFKVTGSGDLGAFPLIATEADINITGSGDASVTALEFLKVRISGSGDVFYKGFPELNVDITGSGDLVDAN